MRILRYHVRTLVLKNRHFNSCVGKSVGRIYKKIFLANMNNVGLPLSDNSQYERPPIAAMFNVPYTYRCDMRREFVKRWCNSNVDIICYVTKV